MAKSNILLNQEEEKEDLKIQTGRRLDRTGATPYLFLMPLLAWVCIQAVVFGISLMALGEMNGPIRDMNAAAMEKCAARPAVWDGVWCYCGCSAGLLLFL